MRTKISDVYLRDWVVAGPFYIDTQYYDLHVYVVAHTDDEILVHERTFVLPIGNGYREDYDDPEVIEAFVKRIQKEGTIDKEHWYFHEFFSRTLEEKLQIEAAREKMEQRSMVLT